MSVMFLKVFVKSDPTIHVWVETTEEKNRTKRNAIQRDIVFQKFQRWAPFAGMQYGSDYTINAYKEDKVTPYF